MTASKIIDALDIPNESRIDQRIAKKLLIENGAITAADKKQINDSIEELIWVAALKPNTIGVPEYRDAEKEVLELAILHLTVRAGTKCARIEELIHRAIPYPVLLVLQSGEQVYLSLATKRWAQNEGGITVLEGEPLSMEIEDDGRRDAFLTALSLRKQARVNLLEVYIGWKALIEAYHASAYTGAFSPAASTEEAERRRLALDTAAIIERELSVLKVQAGRETQMNRRVQLNLDLKRLEKELQTATDAMK